MVGQLKLGKQTESVRIGRHEVMAHFGCGHPHLPLVVGEKIIAIQLSEMEPGDLIGAAEVNEEVRHRSAFRGLNVEWSNRWWHSAKGGFAR